MGKKRVLAILGSTGSIGTQALQVVEEHADLFEIYALTANHNVSLLIEQARRFSPEAVVIADESLYPQLKEALSDLPIKTYTGSQAIAQIVEAQPIDMVLTAMMGYAGLYPTIQAIKSGKAIALANKETLVVAGELITRLALENRVPIIPVDSEHSAIFQCLAGEEGNPIEKIILTASGGPFRTLSVEELKHVTKDEALRHPKWKMGTKITIDSASMMNKGFEVIEARWLFNTPPERIEVVIHPQSIVHSMVQFCDGAIKAQWGLPNMKLPIRYALAYPHRLPNPDPKPQLEHYKALTFEHPDMVKFPLLGYAYEALRQGGNMPCIMSAANEVVVNAFLHDRIAFTDMPRLIAKAMERVPFIASPTYDDYVATDTEARQLTQEWI
ncbi:MAG: 1-deoxy-D-xylulose-5-phosphate reductoisomerase [Porphyromonadaceae bacterium]|nr:1-deoxy-D-xylulose-5-phosphate reductoisomerase [Porphyromonadaceae bacterium]